MAGRGADGRKTLLLLVAASLVGLVGLEFGAAAIWELSLSGRTRRNVRALSGERDAEPNKLPNTFWHHEFNPRHEKYRDTVNSRGTKGPEFALPKPPGELRVLCVGDSTVEGTGVEPHQTFPFQLEGLLAQAPGGRGGFQTVRVVNGGIGSHNTAFNLAYLALRLIHFDPDVVVIKSSYNDYVPYIVPGMDGDYTHAFPDPYHRLDVGSYWSLARRSYLLKVLGVALFSDEVAVPFPNFSGRIGAEVFQRMDFSGNADQLYLFAENIRSMVLLTRGRGMRVVLVDLPTSPDPKHFGEGEKFGERFKLLIQRFEAEIERVAREQGVPFVRTGPFGPEDFWDHVHNTESGNRKVAAGVAGALLRALAGDPPPGPS